MDVDEVDRVDGVKVEEGGSGSELAVFLEQSS